MERFDSDDEARFEECEAECGVAGWGSECAVLEVGSGCHTQLRQLQTFSLARLQPPCKIVE